METNLQSRKWRSLAGVLLLLIASSLCFLCVLSGIRPRLLGEFHIVRISAFHDAIGMMLDAVPALANVLGPTLDKLLQKADVPESLSIYAVSYCSQKYSTGNSAPRQCFFKEASGFDIATGVRIYFALAYELGITSSVLGVAFWWHWMRYGSSNSRSRTRICLKIACITMSVASVTATVLACAAYMILAKNVPQAVLSMEFGGKFFALTWSACICVTLAMAVMRSQVNASVQKLR